MRVALDGRRLQDRPLGGVGRYFARLLPYLSAEVDMVVLTDARREPPDLPGLDVEVRPLGAPPHLTEAPWIQVSVPRWLRRWDGLFHGTFNQLPWATARPMVVTIHDLSFEHHPEDFTALKRRWFHLQARTAVRRAARVLTPTAVVREDVLRTYGPPAERVLVAPNAADPVFGPRARDDLRADLARIGVRPPYVVTLGGAPRRGLPVAVAAWRRAAIAGVPLVAVGKEAPTDPEVQWIGAADDHTWSTVLAGAEAFVYATRYEGFGMPALEAAACGTPVVCARLPALAEVLDNAPEWCEQPTPDSLASGLRRLFDDPGRRRDAAARCLQRAADVPGWGDAAEVTLRAYREAAG